MWMMCENYGFSIIYGFIISCKKCVYSCDVLFMRSQECYFDVYFPRWCATQEINTKITLLWAHKQFATRVHTLFYISFLYCSQWSLLGSKNHEGVIIPPPNEVGGGFVRFSVRSSICRRHGFWSETWVCFGISISNLICMFFVAMGVTLFIFSNVTFKMAA